MTLGKSQCALQYKLHSLYKGDNSITETAEEAVPALPRSSSRQSTVELGGQTYEVVVLNGLTWMAENLNYKVSNSWCYDNDPANCREYGRLYTWQAAQNACEALGWRLPTDEEWREMAKLYGGYYDYPEGKAIGDAEKTYEALIEGGQSGFSAQLGGWRRSDGGLGYLGRSGNYWSATEFGSNQGWLYTFSRDFGKLYRYSLNKSYGHSCRCVRD